MAETKDSENNKNLDVIKSDQPFVIHKEEDDLLGVIPKIKFLKSFLESENEIIQKDRMIALYGGWGSGKSTIMKTLMESELKHGKGELILQLDTNKYDSVFFEAWKYENDDNLALSLIHFILDQIENKISVLIKKGAQESFKEIKSQLLSSAKSALSAGLKELDVSMFGMKLNVGKVIGAGLDGISKEEGEISEYKRIDNLKRKFEKLENDVLKDNLVKKIVIFIDDLDRCEAENVCDMLASIKNFVNLGKNVTFVVGVDKNAVTKALRFKYGNDEEKAEEYLEKIFSFSTSVNKTNTINKLIKQYFSSSTPELQKSIGEFFYCINFVTPRHVKKILNKYRIILELNDLKNHVILESESETKYFKDDYRSIMFIYLMILFEFYEAEFLKVKFYKNKKLDYLAVLPRVYADDGDMQKNIYKYEEFINFFLCEMNLEEVRKISEDKDFLDLLKSAKINNEFYPNGFIQFAFNNTEIMKISSKEILHLIILIETVM